ncbi:MAG: response regulator transcription factor [Actinomycetota bacterium]
MRLLLVEDDPDLRRLLGRALRGAGYAVDEAETLAGATDAAALVDYDLLCLDRRLPDGDGLELCRSLAAGDDRRTRVLLLTALDDVGERVAGLDGGADDYLVKPFDLDELLARLRVLGRLPAARPPMLRHGDVVVDPATGTAHRAGRELELTVRELALLQYFVLHPGELLTAERLIEHVWDANADPFSTSVRVILSRLRRKLGDPPVIHTVPGGGYRLGDGS